MRAMVLEKAKEPLKLQDAPIPKPGKGQLLIKVNACGVCRTDLHVVDGELPDPKLPLIPGHQIVGRVVKKGEGAGPFEEGDRVGVPWLGGSCGHCEYCLSGRENLCDQAVYTGYQIDGGYAEYCLGDAGFCFPIPASYPDLQAAPLLCAGLIGFRALSMTGEARRIGFYGFGASAHILIQVANYQNREVYAFTRTAGDRASRLANKLGAVWTGSSEEPPPMPLDAAIVFASAGSLVPQALKALKKGGTVVCAGIEMSDIPSFPYKILWGERIVRSVANLTRRDGKEFLELAPRIPVQTKVNAYPLEKANEALRDLREGKFSGAAVLVVD